MEQRIDRAFRDAEVVTLEKMTAIYRGMRGITADTMKFFGCYTYLNSKGEEQYQDYVYPSGGIKSRLFPKDFRAKDGFKSDELFGMNLFKDFFAGVRDIFGGRSKASQKVLRDARQTCLTELRREALIVGANAIVAVDLDYSEISGDGKSMLFLVTTGTACRVTKT